jgi:hypothetical protein
MSDEQTTTENTTEEAPVAPPTYLVLAGFLGAEIINEETGEKAQYHPGDVVAFDADTARVELHRDRIAVAEPARVESVRASVRAAQGDDAIFRNVP